MFKDIKVGDVVLVNTKVYCGFKPLFFTVSASVEGYTPTRFTVDGNTYLKRDGSNYGGGSSLERVHVYDNELDQTDRCNAVIKLIKLQGTLSHYRHPDINIDSDSGQEQLDKVYKYVNTIADANIKFLS